MTQEEINKAFEGRWRIKGHVFSAEDHVQGEIKELCRDFFEAGIALSEPHGGHVMVTVEGAIKNNSISKREKKFRESVATQENIYKYGKQMLKDFCDYWTEPNKSQTKMRFELQQTFEIGRRLGTWARNNFNRYDRQQPTVSDRLDKLADILKT